MGKIPYAADAFYEKEAKQKRKDHLFRFKFEDLMIKVEERAQILKAQGKSASGGTKNQTAKVAATTTNNSQPRSFVNIAKDAAENNAFNVSPPKQQPQLHHRPQEKCIICNISHNVKDCARMKSMTIEKRLEELKRRGICFRCLEGGHMARSCPQAANVRCSECNGRHQTLLHGKVGAQQHQLEQQQQPQQEQAITETNA